MSGAGIYGACHSGAADGQRVRTRALARGSYTAHDRAGRPHHRLHACAHAAALAGPSRPER